MNVFSFHLICVPISGKECVTIPNPLEKLMAAIVVSNNNNKNKKKGDEEAWSSKKKIKIRSRPLSLLLAFKATLPYQKRSKKSKKNTIEDEYHLYLTPGLVQFFFFVVL